MKFLSKCYIGLIFLLLYTPIIVLIVFSFNESGSLAEFSGFSLMWYEELFNDEEALSSLMNSLILAISSSVIATVIGTFGALGLHRMKSKYVKGAVNAVTNIPMMNPDIVTGVSMMLLFVAVAAIIKSQSFFGFGTLLIAHVTFNLPYVLLSVMPRFKGLDKSLSEAAQDLGCTPARAFFMVELPEIIPGIISGLMLGFTMSLDDFVISHFVSSPDFQTLPLYVYNQTAHNVKFSMYALSALIVVIILIILLVVNFAGSVGQRKASKKRG
ncbi:MAG: ABC transporter permease [Ruminococcaceae bacterium]|nr:ABC transporter permease [Oscillospiraceae bacterium]